MGCDTMVVLAPAARDGVTLFREEQRPAAARVPAHRPAAGSPSRARGSDLWGPTWSLVLTRTPKMTRNPRLPQC
jgi:hypothetical protein